MSWFTGALKVVYPKCVWSIDKEDRVFLTFDDGPDPTATPLVLNVLKKHQVKATFFCVGKNVVAHPKLFGQIVNDGHAIGNHTFNHENGWTTPLNTYLDSISETSTLFNTMLFRPPYGKITAKQRRYILKRNLQIIMWSWMSHDYLSNRTNTCILRSLKRVKGGDILVFHDNHKTAARIEELIDKTITYLKENQLIFDTLKPHEI